MNYFVGGIEQGCQLSEPLKAFRAELDRRYSFENRSTRLQEKVHIPGNIKGAVGHASAFDRGSYTDITVPFVGSYRNIRTRAISFNIGHSNGINVVTLTFDARRSEVEQIIGPDVLKTQRAFQADPDEKEFGFSARIIDRPRGSALVCDTST